LGAGRLGALFGVEVNFFRQGVVAAAGRRRGPLLALEADVAVGGALEADVTVGGAARRLLGAFDHPQALVAAGVVGQLDGLVGSDVGVTAAAEAAGQLVDLPHLEAERRPVGVAAGSGLPFGGQPLPERVRG